MQIANPQTQDFTPADVFLNTVPPLLATMGKSEAEAAAAMLVRAMQVHGNVWAPMLPRDMGLVLRADLGGKVEPWSSLNRNPFFRPNFDLLIEKGFARWVGDESEGRGRPVEFTAAGLEKLRRWVLPQRAAVQP
jgi:hypothetical protein